MKLSPALKTQLIHIGIEAALGAINDTIVLAETLEAIAAELRSEAAEQKPA